MRRLTRIALVTCVTLYVAMGATIASIMSYAVPATNLLGGLYLMVTWPCWIKTGPCAGALPTAHWMFTFDKPAPRRALDQEAGHGG